MGGIREDVDPEILKQLGEKYPGLVGGLEQWPTREGVRHHALRNLRQRIGFHQPDSLPEKLRKALKPRYRNHACDWRREGQSEISATACIAWTFGRGPDGSVKWILDFIRRDETFRGLWKQTVKELIAECDEELARVRAEIAASRIDAAGGRIIGVVSTTPDTARRLTWGKGATTVVVVLNPRATAAGEPEVTVGPYDYRVPLDIRAVLAEIDPAEPGWSNQDRWGGHGSQQIHSPPGVSSRLTLAQVLAVVERHLK